MHRVSEESSPISSGYYPAHVAHEKLLLSQFESHDEIIFCSPLSSQVKAKALKFRRQSFESKLSANLQHF